MILAIVFLDMVGFTMLIPDVQFRAKSLGADGWVLGALMSSMFASQTVFSPIWSSLSDRVGRRNIFLLCTGFSCVAMLLYAFADHLSLMFVCRILAGIGAANVAVGNALLTNLVSDEERDRAISHFSAAMTAGLLCGPAVGGLMPSLIGRQGLGLLAGGLCLAGIIAGFMVLAKDKPEVVTQRKRNPFGIVLFREVPQLRVLAITAMVAWFALALLEGTFGLLIQHTLGLDEKHFGFLFSYEALVALGCQTWLLMWLRKRLSYRAFLQLCFLFQGAGLVLMPFAPSLVVLVVASTLFALGNAMSTPIVNMAASDLVPKARHGELFGLFQGSRGFGFLVAPAVGTQLFSLDPSYPYIAAGLVCLAGVIALSFSVSSAPASTSAD